MSVEARKIHKAEQKKAALLADWCEVRRKILALAATMTEQQQNTVYLGSWSAREMLAHLAGWDETNLIAAPEILAGKLPFFYQHMDKDWAGYNARLVAEYSRPDFAEQIALVEDSHRRLIDYLETVPAQDLWEDRGVRARGWKVTIGRLLEVEMKDEDLHYQELARFVETAPAG